ncbi:4589_t:CDS:2, partial [Racocetra fulgida]
MFENRLSEIPGPKKQNRRFSVTSNTDTEKPESPEIPSSSEINNKSSKRKRLDIPNVPTPSIPTPSVPDVPSSVGPAASAVSSAVNDAANTAVNAAQDIAAKAQELLSKLLSSFDNFKPKSPTSNIA